MQTGTYTLGHARWDGLSSGTKQIGVPGTGRRTAPHGGCRVGAHCHQMGASMA